MKIIIYLLENEKNSILKNDINHIYPITVGSCLTNMKLIDISISKEKWFPERATEFKLEFEEMINNTKFSPE